MNTFNILRLQRIAIRGAFLGLLAAAITACGGSDSSPPASAPSAPTQLSVPNVVGDTQSAATSAITAAGLTLGTVTQAASASVASGSVISETPAAGASVASGSAIALVISTGTQTFTIGGTVIGLKAAATVHVLNGSDDQSITNNGTFTFPTALASGATFSVSFGAMPAGQICAVQNGSGNVANANVTNILVYCTYLQSVATLNGSYDVAGYIIDADTDVLLNGGTFDGAGNEGVTASLIVNNAGTPTTITNDTSAEGPYTVVTTNAIPVLTTGGNNIGAIAGADADEFFWIADASTANGGGLPALAVGVNPLQNGTIASLAGNWFTAGLNQSSDPNGFAGVLAINADGSVSGSQTNLDVNGVVSVNPQSAPAGTFTVTNGGEFSDGAGSHGYFSANGEFLVSTKTAAGTSPGLSFALKQGANVTQATVNGVYTAGSLTFNNNNTGDGKVFTLFFDGAGNFKGTYIENSAGVIANGNAVSGTYAVTSTGVLTITTADGSMQTGGVSADGNILIAAALTGGGAERPEVIVGFRQ